MAAPSPPSGRRQLGQFEVLAELGRGGMGIVYRARDLVTGREVALKVVLGETDARRRARFVREGEVTASLNHAGIVRVYSAGEVDGLPFLAYELVPGARTLDKVMPELPLRRRVEYVRDAARALGVAHARGLVHRDVKAENLLIDGEGALKVADFGLAAGEGLDRLTRSGAMVGTPSAMAPEQFQGKRAEQGPPTDVWALGVLLYQALTGELPFEGTTISELTVRVCRAEPELPSARGVGVPPALERVCLKALSGAPAARYADGENLARELDRWLAGESVEAPARATRARYLVLVLVLVLVLALALALVLVTSTAKTPIETGAPSAVTTRAAPEVVEDARDDAPDWFARLGPGRAPTLPLPAGIVFSARDREYTARDGSRLVWVPAATLRLGHREVEDVWGQETAFGEAHEVRLTRGFFIGVHEVTWAQVRRFFDERRAPPPSGTIDVRMDPDPDIPGAVNFLPAPGAYHAARGDPAFHVTWDEAAAYCEWAGLRLPSEAEWELAARGTDGRPFAWGSAPPRGRCNYAIDDGHAFVSLPGAFPEDRSPFGCLDMAGNVAEWVADLYAPHGDAAAVDPTGPAAGDRRVVRGGDWAVALEARVQTSARQAVEPTLRDPRIGFRVAR